MEFISVVKKEDWKQLGSIWMVFVPFNCKEEDILMLNILNDEELISNHKEFYESISGGTVLNGYGSIIASKEPEVDILLKIMKEEPQQSQMDLSSLANVFSQLPEEEESVSIEPESQEDVFPVEEAEGSQLIEEV